MDTAEWTRDKRFGHKGVNVLLLLIWTKYGDDTLGDLQNSPVRVTTYRH